MIGLIGAISTGAVAKFFDYRLNKIKHDFEKNVQNQNHEAEELRILKQDLEDRKSEIKKLEDELDKWKGKYYEMLEHLIQLKGQFKNE